MGWYGVVWTTIVCWSRSHVYCYCLDERNGGVVRFYIMGIIMY